MGSTALSPERVRLHEIDRDTVKANQALAPLRVRHGDGSFLREKSVSASVESKPKP